jgi:hypothetical protein
MKTDDRTKINGEYECCLHAASYIKDAYAPIPLIRGARGALVFDLRSATGHSGDVVELDDRYQELLKGGARGDEILAEMLKHLEATFTDEGRLGNAHGRTRGSSSVRTLEAYFGRYARRDSHPDRMSLMFDCSGAPIQVYGEAVSCPLKLLPGLLKEKPALPEIDAVHGDLHLSNVVIATDGPHLVDFAWSERDDHLLKDFVMMESSMRFMRFPRHVHPALMAKVDQVLNEVFFEDDMTEEFKVTADKGLRWTAYAMLRCVCAVRALCMKRCAMVFPDIKADVLAREYFRCLYLVLAGQQRFDTFPLMRLAWIFNSLERLYV